MPYAPDLAERLASVLSGRSGFAEKKMFGGIGWMLNGNMCVGIYKDWLILRVGPDAQEALLREPHVKPMDITGKAMRGWAMVSRDGLGKTNGKLTRFVRLAETFVGSLPPK